MQENKKLLPGILLALGMALLAGWLYQNDFWTPTSGIYPPPGASFDIPYPYPGPPTQAAYVPALAPTRSPAPTAATNLVKVIKPQIFDLPHPIPGGGYSVSFSDSQHGWLVAYAGGYRDRRTDQNSLYATQDGGRNWEWLADVNLGNLDFISVQVGWARRDGKLAMTTDGGLVWNEFPLPDEFFSEDWQLYTFDFESLERGWIVLSQDTPGSIYSGQFRNYRILRTLDGGGTWQPVSLPCASQYDNLPVYWERVVIHLEGHQDAWLVCGSTPRYRNPPTNPNLWEPYGWLYHSRDDGQTWDAMIQVTVWALHHSRPHGISTSDLPSIWFADEQLGWIGTGYFGLLKTSDGGRTWQDQAMPWLDNLPFKDVHGFSLLHGLVTWSNSFGAALAETQDGGQSWQQIFPPPLPRHIQFFDAQNGVGIGSYPLQTNQFFRTSDGGRTWQIIGQIGGVYWNCDAQGIAEEDCIHQVWAFDFVTSQTGYALASGATNRLYVTRDGGATWSPLSTMPSSNLNKAIDFMDEQTGFMSRHEGILVTRDGGHTFEPVNQGGLGYPYQYSFIDASQGVMTGEDQLYWTNDGGKTWRSVLQTRRIADVDLQADGSIWVLSVEYTPTGRGDEVYLWFSPDHGETWQRIDFGKDDPRTYPSFDFIDARHGWLRTSDHLYATADGGRTWQMVR